MVSKKGDLLSLKGLSMALIMLFLYFLLFATQARTAIILFLGELVLLVIYGIYRRDKEILKRMIVILFLIFTAFGGSLLFTEIERGGGGVLAEAVNSSFIAKDDAESLVQKAGKSYISENITSAVGKDKRSNRARFSLMEAELKVWMDHPVLGVGKGLKAAYIPEKLPLDATKKLRGTDVD